MFQILKVHNPKNRVWLLPTSIDLLQPVFVTSKDIYNNFLSYQPRLAISPPCISFELITKNINYQYPIDHQDQDQELAELPELEVWSSEKLEPLTSSSQPSQHPSPQKLRPELSGCYNE